MGTVCAAHTSYEIGHCCRPTTRERVDIVAEADEAANQVGVPGPSGDVKNRPPIRVGSPLVVLWIRLRRHHRGRDKNCVQGVRYVYVEVELKQALNMSLNSALVRTGTYESHQPLVYCRYLLSETADMSGHFVQVVYGVLILHLKDVRVCSDEHE
jgi:hypothetical protein